MNLLAISDIHGDIAGIERLASEFSKADLVLISGDITNFGGRQEVAEIIGRLKEHAKRILAVPGNCDRPEVGAYLAESGMSLDQRAVEIEGLWLAGLGGSLPCPGRTLLEYSEKEMGEALEALAAEIPPGAPFILLCHQPPHGTRLDRVFGGLHVGSRAIRKFIETKNPAACFCGHIHESPGTDKIGLTLAANPGPLSKGGYVRTEYLGGSVSIELISHRHGHVPR